MQLLRTARICTAYITCIEYGDDSGIDERESQLVDDWVSMLPHPHTIEYDRESHFARDEITGLMADCVDAHIYANTQDFD